MGPFFIFSGSSWDWDGKLPLGTARKRLSWHLESHAQLILACKANFSDPMELSHLRPTQELPLALLSGLAQRQCLPTNLSWCEMTEMWDFVHKAFEAGIIYKYRDNLSEQLDKIRTYNSSHMWEITPAECIWSSKNHWFHVFGNMYLLWECKRRRTFACVPSLTYEPFHPLSCCQLHNMYLLHNWMLLAS